MATERVIGLHVDCGGEVVYFSTPSMGRRTCRKCGADGRYGRRSPEIQPENVSGPVVCSYCAAVITPGDPEFAVSHGLGPCCWSMVREANGLPPKPYPGTEATS